MGSAPTVDFTFGIRRGVTRVHGRTSAHMASGARGPIPPPRSTATGAQPTSHPRWCPGARPSTPRQVRAAPAGQDLGLGPSQRALASAVARASGAPPRFECATAPPGAAGLAPAPYPSTPYRPPRSAGGAKALSGTPSIGVITPRPRVITTVPFPPDSPRRGGRAYTRAPAKAALPQPFFTGCATVRHAPSSCRSASMIRASHARSPRARPGDLPAINRPCAT